MLLNGISEILGKTILQSFAPVDILNLWLLAKQVFRVLGGIMFQRKLMFVVLLVLASLLVVSCTGDDPVQPQNSAPDSPASPTVSLLSADPLIYTLCWECNDPDGDSIEFDVYFGTSSSPILVSPGQPESCYTTAGLDNDTRYYWRIVAKDASGEGRSATWNFLTAPSSGGTIDISSNPSGADIILDGALTGYTTPHSFSPVSSGFHTVKLTLDGFADWGPESIQVEDGEVSVVSATLGGLNGYWEFHSEFDDLQDDPGNYNRIINLVQSGSNIEFTCYCEGCTITAILNGNAISWAGGDNDHFNGTATESSMEGSITVNSIPVGTWTALKMAQAPDEYSCVRVNVDIFCIRKEDGSYIVVGQIDDPAQLVESATLSGDLLSGAFSLSETMDPDEYGEWLTDIDESGLVVSQGTEPEFPLNYLMQLQFTNGASLDVQRTISQWVDEDAISSFDY